MSDQDRAAGLIHLVAGAQSGIEALEAVVAEFAAVRLEERRAIVAYLRTTAGAVGTWNAARSALHQAADQIEHGGHAS
jgi:hypothetical protein